MFFKRGDLRFFSTIKEVKPPNKKKRNSKMIYLIIIALIISLTLLNLKRPSIRIKKLERKVSLSTPNFLVVLLFVFTVLLKFLLKLLLLVLVVFFLFFSAVFILFLLLSRLHLCLLIVENCIQSINFLGFNFYTVFSFDTIFTLINSLLNNCLNILGGYIIILVEESFNIFYEYFNKLGELNFYYYYFFYFIASNLLLFRDYIMMSIQFLLSIYGVNELLLQRKCNRKLKSVFRMKSRFWFNFLK